MTVSNTPGAMDVPSPNSDVASPRTELAPAVISLNTDWRKDVRKAVGLGASGNDQTHCYPVVQ